MITSVTKFVLYFNIMFSLIVAIYTPVVMNHLAKCHKQTLPVFNVMDSYTIPMHVAKRVVQ